MILPNENLKCHYIVNKALINVCKKVFLSLHGYNCLGCVRLEAKNIKVKLQ